MLCWPWDWEEEVKGGIWPAKGVWLMAAWALSARELKKLDMVVVMVEVKNERAFIYADKQRESGVLLCFALMSSHSAVNIQLTVNRWLY